MNLKFIDAKQAKVSFYVVTSAVCNNSKTAEPISMKFDVSNVLLEFVDVRKFNLKQDKNNGDDFREKRDEYFSDRRKKKIANLGYAQNLNSGLMYEKVFPFTLRCK